MIWVFSGIRSIVVLLNDIDVVVLLLHYLYQLMSKGLEEIWIKFDVGQSTRLLPIYIIGTSIGQQLSSVILLMHILTGCDVTSKIGTKAAVLKTQPENYLMNFGEHSTLTDKNINAAE